MFTTNHPFATSDDASAGSRSNHDHSSMISASTTANNDALSASGAFNPAASASSYNAFSTTTNNGAMMMENHNNNNNTVHNANNASEEDALTLQAEATITTERQHLTKENTAKLQSILENIKDSTKNILNEMNVFLKETEEVEKVYVRCRAKTTRESRRLEQVEPEVLGILTGVGAGGSGMMGMMGMFGGSGGMMMGMNDGVDNASGGTNAITPRDSL